MGRWHPWCSNSRHPYQWFHQVMALKLEVSFPQPNYLIMTQEIHPQDGLQHSTQVPTDRAGHPTWPVRKGLDIKEFQRIKKGKSNTYSDRDLKELCVNVWSVTDNWVSYIHQLITVHLDIKTLCYQVQVKLLYSRSQQIALCRGDPWKQTQNCDCKKLHLPLFCQEPFSVQAHVFCCLVHKVPGVWKSWIKCWRHLRAPYQHTISSSQTWTTLSAQKINQTSSFGAWTPIVSCSWDPTKLRINPC